MRDLLMRLAVLLGLTTDPEVEPTEEDEQVDVREYVFLMHEPLIREYVEKNKLNIGEGGGHAQVHNR